jgi:hypothetical protein
MNETTRTYPRTLDEAFPENTTAIEKRNKWMWFEEQQAFSPDAEFWTYIALAFGAGFLLAVITIGK